MDKILINWRYLLLYFCILIALINWNIYNRTPVYDTKVVIEIGNYLNQPIIQENVFKNLLDREINDLKKKYNIKLIYKKLNNFKIIEINMTNYKLDNEIQDIISIILSKVNHEEKIIIKNSEKDLRNYKNFKNELYKNFNYFLFSCKKCENLYEKIEELNSEINEKEILLSTKTYTKILSVETKTRFKYDQIFIIICLLNLFISAIITYFIRLIINYYERS